MRCSASARTSAVRRAGSAREQVQVSLPRVGYTKDASTSRPDAPTARAVKITLGTTASSSSTRRSATDTSWASGTIRTRTQSSPELERADPEKRRTSLGDIVTNNYVWRSIFRTATRTPAQPRPSSQPNVWLHLHPSKMRRHGIRYRHTWCAGGSLPPLSLHRGHRRGADFYYVPPASTRTGT